MKQLNDIETRVLELIPYSADRPTSCEYIASNAGITERTATPSLHIFSHATF